MAMTNELYSEDQHVYTCKICKKVLETSYNCLVCYDFHLCITCFEKDGHPHKMAKLDFGLNDDSGTSDQKAINPQEQRRVSIRRCIQLMVHACQCRDANCRLTNCQMRKRVIQHAKSCKRKINGRCSICRQFIALCYHHTNQCQKTKCPVPFCLNIKRKLRTPQFQEHLKQARILKTVSARSKIHFSQTVHHQSPCTSTSTNQLSSSLKPYTLPHTSQSGISIKPTTGPPAGALEAVQDATAAEQQAPPIVTAGNYRKNPLIGQPVEYNSNMIPAHQQIQVQIYKPIPQMMTDVAMNNAVAPMGSPQVLSNVEPGSSVTQSN